MLQQQGDSALEKYVEQFARSLRGAVSQTDVAVKYTAWSLAFILPDTGSTNAKNLAEKLRQACGDRAGAVEWAGLDI